MRVLDRSAAGSWATRAAATATSSTRLRLADERTE